MNGAKSILEMLNRYKITHVFGLIGETSFPLYYEWNSFEPVEHIFGRDERNVAIMAEAYARVSGKPGLCEVPGVGASYTLPAIVEAYTSGTPLIELSSDIATSAEKKNVLTEYDKTSMFSRVTREVLNIYSPGDIPRMVRYAFRVATTPPSGPVFVRFPLDVYGGNVSDKEIYAEDQFSKFPSIRLSCSNEDIESAAKLLIKSSHPVIICGQGVLYSGAFSELKELSELLAIPVGTTISGKGSFPENHPLSIGVVGSRGGTEISRQIVDSADLIFFIGTNTDSASTSGWKSPDTGKHIDIIHLDSDVRQLGNNYNITIPLLGDAKAILGKLNSILAGKGIKKSIGKEILESRNRFESQINGLLKDSGKVNPVTFINALMKYAGNNPLITADPGIGAIYTSAFYKCARAGRQFIFNYSVGGLGYSLPAAIGSYYAKKSTIICLTSDGSMGFNEGELETIVRYRIPVKIFIFNNESFGWIRATMVSDYGKVIKGSDFKNTKYEYIARGHSLDYAVIENDRNVDEVVKKVLSDDSPALIEVKVYPEDQLLPPVPEWKHISAEKKIIYMG